MVVVLNFGSQFAHLIARRVRDLGVKAEILPFNASVASIIALKPKGIILSGGPASVIERGSPKPAKKVFEFGVPVLGICYGEQVMAEMLGGRVAHGEKREYGRETLSILARHRFFRGLKSKETVWFSHGDTVTKLPRGFVRAASTANCPNAAIVHAKKNWYGIQFHPEVTHTTRGARILSNFLFGICCAERDWKMGNVGNEIIRSLKEKIGTEHVLVGLSGGIDSLVAATLLRRAIGGRLHPIFVDTGLLRKDEAVNIERTLKGSGFKNLHMIQASKVFLERLKGVRDPERKRKIIGHTFIEVFRGAMKRELKRYSIRFFAQGTIYPDRVESAKTSKDASKIKTHHNLALPRKLGFEIIEPLKDLYKDEVRRLGERLGLPREFIWQHPFPGPGLAVRIVGEVTEERLTILRAADAIFLEELRQSGEYDKMWIAFAVLLPLRTTGVMGDARTYEHMISLRAVDSVDTMTADWHKMPPELLEKVSTRIVGEVRGVNRVLYDVTQKPPATIEYE